MRHVAPLSAFYACVDSACHFAPDRTEAGSPDDGMGSDAGDESGETRGDAADADSSAGNDDADAGAPDGDASDADAPTVMPDEGGPQVYVLGATETGELWKSAGAARISLSNGRHR